MSSNTDIIQDAETEVEELCGKKFTNGTTITEYLSTPRQDVFNNSRTNIQTSLYPVQSISSFNLQDINGSITTSFAALTGASITAGTFQTNDYWLEVAREGLSNSVLPNGRVVLKTQTIAPGFNNVYIVYTYGYATVPNVIRDLAACLAGIRAWTNFLGGNYNRLNNYSIPQQTVSKGDFYQRGAQNIQQLNDEANRILDRVGRKARTLYFSTGASI